MTSLSTWRKKLNYLLEKEAVASDPEQKFHLKSAIEECQQKIAELENKQQQGSKTFNAPKQQTKKIQKLLKTLFNPVIKDRNLVINLSTFFLFLLIVISLKVVTSLVAWRQTQIIENTVKDFQDFKKSKDEDEKASHLMSVMEKAGGINRFFAQKYTQYILQKMNHDLQLNNDILCNFSSSPLWTVDFDGNQIATGGWSRKVYIWDVTKQCSDNHIKTWKADDIISSVDFNHQQEKILAVAAGVKVNILKQENEVYESYASKSLRYPILNIDVSLNGKMIAIAGGNGSVVLWNFENQNDNVNFCPTKVDKPIRDVEFYPNLSSKLLAAGGEDGQLNLWNVRSWSRCREETDRNHQVQPIGEGSKGWIWSIGFHPQRKLMVTGGGDSILRLWKMEYNSWNLTHTWPTQQTRITSVQFNSSQGKILATAGWDGTIKLWNLSGTPLAHWTAPSPVVSLSFNDNGKKIATAHLDGTIRVWNIPTLNELMFQSCQWLNDRPSGDSKKRKRQQNLCKNY
ncbi:MAG: hypothetical protein QNJ42_20370 [Crocosphaera sp.]|nr:hypothetical protein [Crocosphaera sp.]